MKTNKKNKSIMIVLMSAWLGIIFILAILG